MEKVTLTEIRKFIKSNGGTYEKCKSKINGQDAYVVNGETMTKDQMIDRYLWGEL